MLPKKKRANKKDVDLLFKKGRSVASPDLIFRFILMNKDFSSRISFIAPKNIAKLAVERNLLRRHGYTALSKYINQPPLGILGVFIFKKAEKDIQILENEIKTIFNKIH